MWSRFLNIFTAKFALWRIASSASPAQLILGLLAILITPYLVYIFWGTVIFFILLAVGGWLLYRAYKKRTNQRSF